MSADSMIWKTHKLLCVSMVTDRRRVTKIVRLYVCVYTYTHMHTHTYAHENTCACMTPSTR